MSLDFNQIKSLLLQDSEFFNSYKETFRINFLSQIREGREDLLSNQALNTLIDRLYILLFSLEKDPRREFETFLSKLINLEIFIGDILKKLFILMLRDYCNYMIENNLISVRRVNALSELIEIYSEIIDKVSEKLVHHVREKGYKERTKLEGERKLILDIFESGRIKEVEILIFYKEVPVVCKTPILSVEETSIKVKLCGVYPFKSGEEVFIKHNSFPKPVLARVEEVNAVEEFMWLDILGFTEVPQERRKYLRVVPKKPITISIKKGMWKGKGVIADISVGGVGVFLKDKNELNINDEVELSFSLPKGKIETKAIVRNIKEMENIYRIGFEYKLDVKKEEIVSDYVMERQFEILRDLKKLSGRS